MGWTKVNIPKKHICDKPHLSASHPDIAQYDVIRCDCGQHWECIGFDTGMQWDPYPAVIKWKKIDKPK